METVTLNRLLGDDRSQLGAGLAQFNKQHQQVFNFSHLTTSGQWVPLWNRFFELLADPVMGAHQVECLVAIKLLSRDKTYLNETVREEQLDCLLGLAGVGKEASVTPREEVQVEALKCLSNLIFQSSKCQELCLFNDSTEGIMRRIKTYKYVADNNYLKSLFFKRFFLSRDGNVCYDIRYFDMKLLFLLTAINRDIRAKVREELHGLTYLVETLDLFMGQAAEAKEFNVSTISKL